MTAEEMIAEEIRRMPVSVFRALGYLQEVNRLFLHPRGLALEVVIKEDGTEAFGGIWDYRDDPEGIIFVGAPPSAHQARIVEAEYRRHAEYRSAMFGSPVQPISGGDEE